MMNGSSILLPLKSSALPNEGLAAVNEVSKVDDNRFFQLTYTAIFSVFERSSADDSIIMMDAASF